MNNAIIISNSDLQELAEAIYRKAVSETLEQVREAMNEFARQPEKMYTKQEMADLFRVSLRTIDRWNKMLPADMQPIRIGGAVRYDNQHIGFFKSICK